MLGTVVGVQWVLCVFIKQNNFYSGMTVSGGIATELRDRIYSGQKDLESGMAMV